MIQILILPFTYRTKRERWKFFQPCSEYVEQLIGNIPVDIVILNDTNSILAFESIKGTKLFVKEEAKDIHAEFYSDTCRKYEYRTFWMSQQLKYRSYEVQWDN